MVAPDPPGADVPGFAEFARGGATAVAEIAADRLARAISRGDDVLITACMNSLARAVSAIPADHELRGKYMTCLVAGYGTRFKLADDTDDQREGIEWGEWAASTIPSGHPGRVVALYLLAEEYLRRFHRLRDIEDLSAAITTGELALSEADGDLRPPRGEILSVLGNAYWLRFGQGTSPADLDASIEHGEAALALLEANYPGRYPLLVGVATALLTRFQQDRQPATLRKAIVRLDEALTQPHAPNRGQALWAVATAYLEMFGLTGQVSDLRCCGLRTTEALADMADLARLDVGVHVADLATAFLGVESPDGIEHAVMFGRLAAEHVPAGHPYHLVALSNLSVALRSRFEQFGDPDDIREAIEFGARAVRLTRTDSPPQRMARAQAMQNLSLCYRRRFEVGSDFADQRAAERFARRAAESLALNNTP